MGTSLRLAIVAPVLRLGPFDVLKTTLGLNLQEILEPMLDGAVHRRPSPQGPAVEVFPIAVPEGEGLVLPLGQFGEVGVMNQGGALVLTTPVAAGPWVTQRLGAALVWGPARVRSADGTATVLEMGLRLLPGQRVAVPLSTLGELALEVR